MKDKKLKISFESMSKINIVLMKFAGLLAFDKKSISSARTTFLLMYGNISIAFIIIMYISKAVNNSLKGLRDFEVIAGCIGLSGLYLRYLLLCSQRAKIAALLLESQELWAILSDSEKQIIR
jgi:hypothetical protein